MFQAIQTTLSTYGSAVREEFASSQAQTKKLLAAKTLEGRVVLSCKMILRPIACALVAIISLGLIAPLSLGAIALNEITSVDKKGDFKRIFDAAIYHGLVRNPVAILIQPFGVIAALGSCLADLAHYKKSEPEAKLTTA